MSMKAEEMLFSVWDIRQILKNLGYNTTPQTINSYLGQHVVMIGKNYMYLGSNVNEYLKEMEKKGRIDLSGNDIQDLVDREYHSKYFRNKMRDKGAGKNMGKLSDNR